MAIKYVEVRTQKWDTWLVKLDDSEFTTEEAQRDAAYEAVEDEVSYDEAYHRFPDPVEHSRHTTEDIETFYARHNGKDHVIDYTNP